MYTITNNGQALYDPRLQGLPVGSPKLTQEANTFDTLSFTLYPSHPAYNLLSKKDSILTVYRDNELLAQFIPTYKRRVFNGGIEYKCKSVIALLDDFYYRTTDYTGSVSGFISNIISSFNARVASNYHIQPGNIHEGSVEYSAPNPRTFWKALQTVTENNGGYIVPRFSSGTIYLDYLTDADLPVSNQKIVFGENLTDLFIETDTDNCFSVLYPFGTDEDDNVVSIASVNGGLDYLENSSAVASYGRREKVITWTNVTSPSQLLSLAQAQLSKIAALFSESVQLSAVDLHDAGVSVSTLKFLTNIDCISAPHNYSHRYPVTGMETVLDAPQSVTIKLGPIPMTLTESFALEREKNAATRAGGGGGRAQAKAENEFKKFQTFYTQTDEKFNWLATESEWDELAQAGHVTAFTELTRTARYVEDSAKMELPFEDWKGQWIIAHPEDAELTDDALTDKYNAWIKENPYAIYNTEYSDATRTERIISKTGIDSLGTNETIMSRITQEADRVESSVYASQSQVYSAIGQTASNIRVELTNTEQNLYNYINMTASGIRQQITNAGNRTIVNDTDPRGATYTPKEGDIWIESVHDGTWDGADGFDWEHDEDYDWTQVQGAKVWTWKNDQWQLVADRQQLVTYSDFVNTADILISQKISELANEQGQVEVYRSLIEQSAEQIRAEVYGATSNIYTYIHQTASSVSIAAGQRPTTVVQNSHTDGTPTSINGRGLKENDIWIDTADQDSWDAALDFNWNDDIDYNWNDLRSDKIYVYRNGAWQLAVDGTILAEDTDLQVERDRIALLARNIDTLDGYARENFAQVNVRANEIYSEVLDKTNNLGSSIKQTATQIRSEVHAANSQIYSEINQTASNIMLHVENAVSDLGATLEVTASQIRSDVYATQSSVYSSIVQTASQIRSEVRDVRNNLESSITQNANEISLRVKKGEIASTINQTAQSVLISASRINLEGYVTATELDAEKARFDNLTSGATTAATLKTNLLSASTGFNYQGSAISKNSITIGSITTPNQVLATGAINLSHSHSITLSASGGVITATIGGAQTANGSANFNIADTAFHKNAVSAARASSLSTITLGSGDTGTSTQTVTVYSDDDEEIDLNTTVDASAVYEAGKTDAHAEYTSHTGYLRGSSVSVTPVGDTSYLMKFYGNTTLYKKNGDNYESVGAHPWYYVGSGGTRLYVAGTAKTYYNSGSYITYYTKD